MTLRKEAIFRPDEPLATRVKFEGAEQKSEGAEHWIEVALSYDDARAVGRSDRSSGLDDVRAAVEATVRAIAELTGREVECEVADTDIVRAFNDEYIVVLVTLSFRGRELKVFGKCRERDELADAAACAVLDAVNHYLPLALEADAGSGGGEPSGAET